MTIHVNYGGEIFHARVLYNFKQLSNVIILRFNKALIGDESEMVLTYDPLNNQWQDLDGAHLINKSLFDQILLKLHAVVSECGRFLTANFHNYRAVNIAKQV